MAIERKLVPKQVRLARKLHKQGRSQGYIAERIGVCASSVKNLLRGVTYKNVK